MRPHPGEIALDVVAEQADPDQPETGPYRLSLFDGSGSLVLDVPFGVEEPTDGAGSPSFFFEVDLTPDQEAAIQSAQITAPNGTATVALARTSTLAARAPLAMSWMGGVHLGWDHGAHPRIMVRDPRSGEIIASGRDGSLDLATDAKELELIMMDGIRTRIQRVQVIP